VKSWACAEAPTSTARKERTAKEMVLRNIVNSSVRRERETSAIKAGEKAVASLDAQATLTSLLDLTVEPTSPLRTSMTEGRSFRCYSSIVRTNGVPVFLCCRLQLATF
jgi:hypothetical protein